LLVRNGYFNSWMHVTGISMGQFRLLTYPAKYWNSGAEPHNEMERQQKVLVRAPGGRRRGWNRRFAAV